MNVQHFCSFEQVSVAASATRYYKLVSGDITGGNTTEAAQQIKVFSPGTVSLIGIYIAAEDRADSTWRTRINGADGNAVITITGTGQFEDASNTDALVDDDLANFSLVTGAGGTTFSPGTAWYTFAPTSGTQVYIGNADGNNFSGTADLFFPFCRTTSIATEADAQAAFAASQTLQAGQIRVPTNTRSETTRFRARINAVNGNLVIAYAAAATGVVEDVTNTDAVADTDEANWMWDQNGGSGTLNITLAKIEVSGTDSYPIEVANNATQAAALTWYHPISGRTYPDETTEADAQMKSNVALTLSDLYGYLSAFSLIAGDLTVRTRINGADGNLALAFSTTGQVADTSNTDAVADDDEVNYSFVTGGIAGTVTPRVFSLLASLPVAPAAVQVLGPVVRPFFAGRDGGGALQRIMRAGSGGNPLGM